MCGQSERKEQLMAKSTKSKIKPLTEEEAGKAVGGQQRPVAVILDEDPRPSRPQTNFPGTVTSS